jgi:hypothetical protein
MSTPAVNTAGTNASVPRVERDRKPGSRRHQLAAMVEDRAAVVPVLRDAFVDAVIMGIDPEAMRAVLAAMVARRESPDRP